MQPLTAVDQMLAVLLLAMEEYPEPTRRRDRFLIQAAWSEASDVDVPERVRTAHSMHTGAVSRRCMQLTDPLARVLQWRVLFQTMGKAGKGTAWAEYKLESIISVPSLISESVIMEDDEEGSTPGSTPAKESPRLLRDEDSQDNLRTIGHSLLGTVCPAAVKTSPGPLRKFDVTGAQVGESDDESPETTSSSPPAPLALEVEEDHDVVAEEDGAVGETASTAPVLEKAPVADPVAAAEEAAAPAAVSDRQESKPAAPKILTDDEAEAERMMAETNALVFECGYIPRSSIPCKLRVNLTVALVCRW